MASEKFQKVESGVSYDESELKYEANVLNLPYTNMKEVYRTDTRPTGEILLIGFRPNPAKPSRSFIEHFYAFSEGSGNFVSTSLVTANDEVVETVLSQFFEMDWATRKLQMKSKKKLNSSNIKFSMRWESKFARNMAFLES